jgi:hypothetical protein
LRAAGEPGAVVCSLDAAAAPSVSGRTFHPSGTRTRRAMSASQNMDCQPKAGIMPRPRTAAAVPPSGTPDIMSVAIAPRRRGEMSSAAMAFAEGTRPPSPRPATRRRAAKAMAPGAPAHRTVATEKTTAQSRIARRRPHASERRPANTAPIIMPMNAIEPIVPADAALRPQPVPSMRLFWTVP